MFFSATHHLPDSFLSICDVFLCGVNPSLSILSHLHLSLAAAASGFSEPQVSNPGELVPPPSCRRSSVIINLKLLSPPILNILL